MNRPLRNMALVAAIALLAPSFARAEVSQKAYRYLWLRQNLHAICGVTVGQVRSQLDKVRGRVIELGGEVCGISCLADKTIVEGEQTVSFLLKTWQGDSAFIECEANVPEVTLGRRVWVLVKIPDDAQSLTSLELMEIVAADELSASSSATSSTQGASSRRVQGDSTNVRATATPGRGVYPARLADISTAYARLALKYNPALSTAEAMLIGRKIVELSAKYGVARPLIASMIKCESNFNPRAVSRAGAIGLGQLMPGTAQGLGVTDSFDIAQNIEGAVKYLAAQLKRYQGRTNWEQFALGMACYNAGPGAVAKYSGIPPYRETIAYIDRVAQYFREFDAWERGLLSGGMQ